MKLLADLQGHKVSSLCWSQNGQFISVGSSKGDTEVYDAERGALVRRFTGHSQRVSASSWQSSNILSTASRDKTIKHRDLRMARDFFMESKGHKAEVCGLKWSPDGTQLASGGNDNKLILWSLKASEAEQKFSQHTAAVKAIGWAPNQRGILASGGGTQDRHIRFWNTQSMQMIHQVDTGSQVCNLVFSKNSDELVSTHGFPHK